MHPVYRQLIIVAIALISIISTCRKCRQQSVYEQSKQGWSPEVEQQMYEVFYARTSQMAIDETGKKEFANCCIEKLKQKFPDGPASMTSALSDSLTVAGLKIGSDCAKSLEKHVDLWQPEVVQQFKLQLYSYPETKLLPEEAKSTYVDCIAYKVKIQFHNGIGDGKPKVMRDFIEKCRLECLKLTVNKYKNRLKKNHTAK